MKNIITIQHTQSIHHTNGMIGAWTDWDLSELGKKEAYNIGKALKNEINPNNYIMYSSDLKRAKQTADGVNIHLGMTPILTKQLREINAGIDTQTTIKWFNENKAIKDESKYDPDYKPFPNAESERELWNRIYSFMTEIINSSDENIIIVSHGISLSRFFSMWINDDFSCLEKSGFWTMAGGVSKLYVDDNGRRTIKILNDMSYKK